MDTGLGPQLVHVHYITNRAFLKGAFIPEFPVNLFKLMAYRGIQVRGPLYFHEQRPSQEHLIILANVVLGHFLNRLVDGEISKALSRLREGEIILSYIGWYNARQSIDLKTVWPYFDKDVLMPNELEEIRQALLNKIFEAKETVQIRKLATLISAELKTSIFL